MEQYGWGQIPVKWKLWRYFCDASRRVKFWTACLLQAPSAQLMNLVCIPRPHSYSVRNLDLIFTVRFENYSKLKILKVFRTLPCRTDPTPSSCPIDCVGPQDIEFEHSLWVLWRVRRLKVIRYEYNLKDRSMMALSMNIFCGWKRKIFAIFDKLVHFGLWEEVSWDWDIVECRW